MEKTKYNGNALDVLKSKRFISVITGVLVAAIVTVIPDLEANREQLYGLIALVFGGLAAGYNIEDWIDAAFRVMNGDPLPTPQDDIFKDIQEKNTDNPSVTLPDTGVTFDPIRYEFGTLDSSTYTWRDEGKHPHAPIEIPNGFNYTFTPRTDKNGDPYPHKALNTDLIQQHTRMNIAWVAGDHSFVYRDMLAVTPGKYTVELTMNADVNIEDVGEPYYNWIAVHALVDGQRIGNLDFEIATHANPRNGKNVFRWHYETDKATTVQLGFLVQVHHAYAQANSVLDLKQWQLEKKDN
jgi:hypothetical protein